ncbi:MAG TPA: monovalent cation/H+ antiporter subunit D [Azoarcus sp.]|nr:monovalent cation/H+ antiporter subunit D [Azoarcus sp.]
MNHWVLLPVLLPALIAPLIVIATRFDIVLTRVFSVLSLVLLVIISAILVGQAFDGSITSYELGNWAAPFGIVLVLDRLSAILVLLTSVVGLFVLLYALNGWDRRGQHFHALYQFQLMGINGAFLTGDLFNLFVFFEVLLIASYGLMVHGGGALRVKAGVQYVVANIVGAGLFLFAVGLIYGVTGTLNMADIAMAVKEIPASDQALLQTGGLLLLIVFAMKAALVPVQFWLPGTYTNAPAPVAALFAVMTKVGAYAIIRVFTLIFGGEAGESSWLAAPWLLPSAMVTLAIGAIGVLAARSLGQMVSFAVVASMGTLLIAVGVFSPSAMAAALYYMLHSTLAAAALFLIADLVTERRARHADILSVAPRFMQAGLVSALFFIAAIAMVGMPPLSGFVGKLLILDGLRAEPGAMWIWALILVSSLLLIVGFSRAGSILFWKSAAQEGRVLARLRPRAVPFVATGGLLASIVLLTVFAGPVMVFLEATALQIFNPGDYQSAVLLGESGGTH